MEESLPPRFGLRLVTALSCEAKPLIHRFQLEAIPGDHPFAIYRDANRLYWLIVSGVGRQAAAAATAYLAGLSATNRATAWLNVGISGHASLPIGEARFAHKITDAVDGASYYPPVIFEGCDSEALITVSEPQASITSRMLVDMEGSAFYAAASIFASPDLVHCLKIVSDHGMEPNQRPSKKEVTGLISNQLPKIESSIGHLLDLSNNLSNRWADPLYFDAILAEHHFTVTQRSRLRHLLQRWQVLLEGEDVVEFVWKHAATAKEALSCLEERLDSVVLVLPKT